MSLDILIPLGICVVMPIMIVWLRTRAKWLALPLHPLPACWVFSVLWAVFFSLAGTLATAIAFLYPVDSASVSEGLWTSIRLFLSTWKQYLLIPVAALAVALGFVLSRDKEKKTMWL